MLNEVKKQYQSYLERKERARKERGETVLISDEIELSENIKEPFRFGVIGTGYVFDRWVKDVQRIPKTANISIKGVASGKSNTAMEKVKKYHLEELYPSFEEMLKDEEIKAVYVATPNQLHHQHVIQALRAGKHVLCEKPIAVNTRELREMYDAADNERVFLMEGLWTRTLPIIRELAAVVENGLIGSVKFIETSCCNANTPDKYPAMFSAEKAGGALMDVGCYGLHFVRMLTHDRELEVKCSSIILNGVDTTSTMLLSSNDRMAIVSQSIGSAGGARAVIHGTKGSIEVPLFLFPSRFTVTEDNGFKHHYQYERDAVERPIGYAYEVVHFADCVRTGANESNLIPRADTLLVAEQMEKARQLCGIKLGSEIDYHG